MGLQVGSVCYPDAATASQAVAASESGKVVPAGSVVYVTDVVADGVGVLTYTLTDLTGSVSPLVTVVTPTHAQCSLLETADALYISWGVVVAWILAYALLSLRKGI